MVSDFDGGFVFCLAVLAEALLTDDDSILVFLLFFLRLFCAPSFGLLVLYLDAFVGTALSRTLDFNADDLAILAFRDHTISAAFDVVLQHVKHGGDLRATTCIRLWKQVSEAILLNLVDIDIVLLALGLIRIAFFSVLRTFLLVLLFVLFVFLVFLVFLFLLFLLLLSRLIDILLRTIVLVLILVFVLFLFLLFLALLPISVWRCIILSFLLPIRGVFGFFNDLAGDLAGHECIDCIVVVSIQYGVIISLSKCSTKAGRITITTFKAQRLSGVMATLTPCRWRFEGAPLLL
jgi:hypothetical protein